MENVQAPPADEWTNRRRHERVPADAAIELYGTDRRPLLLGPDLLDIHQRGFRLKLCDRLEPGQTLRFKIQLSSGLVRGRARVRWLKTRLVGYQCGLEIQSMGRLHAYRLSRFLDPDRFNVLKLGDWMLASAALAVAAWVIADRLGFWPWGLP